jgi:hypothetical protein
MKVLSAVPMQQAMENLGAKFEHATGCKLDVTLAALAEV